MNLSQRHSFLALSLKFPLVLLYNSTQSFTKSTIASSSESIKFMLVMCHLLYRDCNNCNVPASPSASVSVSLLSILACCSRTSSSAEYISPLLASSLLAYSLCFCASSSLSLASLSSLLHCISAAMSPSSNSGGVSVGTSVLLTPLLSFLGPIFIAISSVL